MMRALLSFWSSLYLVNRISSLLPGLRHFLIRSWRYLMTSDSVSVPHCITYTGVCGSSRLILPNCSRNLKSVHDIVRWRTSRLCIVRRVVLLVRQDFLRDSHLLIFPEILKKTAIVISPRYVYSGCFNFESFHFSLVLVLLNFMASCRHFLSYLPSINSSYFFELWIFFLIALTGWSSLFHTYETQH